MISRALEYLTCYDQLNVSSLAGAEVLVRRKALIEQAHAGRPDAPSYEGAEHFEGVTEQTDGSMIDPALTRFVASRLGAKADIQKQSQKFFEEKNHAERRREGGNHGGKAEATKGAKGADREGAEPPTKQ